MRHACTCYHTTLYSILENKGDVFITSFGGDIHMYNIMPLTHFECRIQIVSCATPCSLLFFVTWTRFGDSVHNITIILYMTLYMCDVKISHLSEALGPCRGSARPTHYLSFSSSFLCHMNRLSAQCHDICVCDVKISHLSQAFGLHGHISLGLFPDLTLVWPPKWHYTQRGNDNNIIVKRYIYYCTAKSTCTCMTNSAVCTCTFALQKYSVE